MKTEIDSLKNQLVLEQTIVQRLRREHPVHYATKVERKQEQVIRATRQGNTSFWRQPQQGKVDEDSQWWRELEPAIVERFAKGTRLRRK